MKRAAVVILNWNGCELLRRYLPQVLANTNAELADVVVADNASTDGSLECLASEFPSVGVVRLDRNYGFAGGYNRALAKLHYEFVVLLNSDVAPEVGWLEPLVFQMDIDPNLAACAPKILDDKDRTKFEYAGAAGGYLDMFGYPFCRGRIFDNVEKDLGQYDDSVDCLWVSGAALMTRRELYLTTGGLDEDFFAHMEEIDLCWRLVNRGMSVRSIGASSVYHLGGATLSAANPHKTYLNFRNSIVMLVKNHNSRLWPAVLLGRMVLDGVAGLRFLISGQASFCWAIVRAHFYCWSHLRRIVRKRRILASTRTRHLPLTIKRFSIAWQCYVLGKKQFTEL